MGVPILDLRFFISNAPGVRTWARMGLGGREIDRSVDVGLADPLSRGLGLAVRGRPGSSNCFFGVPSSVRRPDTPRGRYCPSSSELLGEE